MDSMEVLVQCSEYNTICDNPVYALGKRLHKTTKEAKANVSSVAPYHADLLEVRG